MDYDVDIDDSCKEADYESNEDNHNAKEDDECFNDEYYAHKERASLTPSSLDSGKMNSKGDVKFKFVIQDEAILELVEQLEVAYHLNDSFFNVFPHIFEQYEEFIRAGQGGEAFIIQLTEMLELVMAGTPVIVLSMQPNIKDTF